MGFPCAAIAKAMRFVGIITSLVEILHYLKSMAIEALPVPYRISFIPEPAEPEQEEAGQIHDVLMMDGLSPCLVPVPTHILSSLIKNRSTILQYGTYLERNGGGIIDLGGGETSPVCSVCLGRIFQGDEIRELCNCCHVFHRECLDQWVDEKKVTCPLCRAALYPADWDWRTCRENLWKVERVAYFLGEEDDSAILPS